MEIAGREGQIAAPGRYTGAGLVLGLVFWLAETLAHATIFHDGAFVDELWPRDGNELWMRSFTSLLFVISGLSVQLTINRLRRAEARSRLLARAVEEAGEAILVADAGGQIVYVNPAFCRTTGYAVDEVIGKNPRLLQSGAGDPAFYAQLWETITSGKLWQGAITDRRKDGRFYPAHLTIAPVIGAQGSPTHYVGIQIDRSEQAALEEQLRQAQKMEALGTLVGGIAHDFNNVLATIIAHADLGLLKRDDPTRVRRGFERIKVAAAGAAGMIAHLLTFVRRRAGAMKEPPAALDLGAWFANLRPSLETAVPEGVALVFQVEADRLGARIEGFQFQEIVQNLLRNAGDALEGREGARVQVILADRPAAPPGSGGEDPLGEQRCVSVRVTDNGPGVPPEQAERIFEPFFTTKAPGKGTGLGLAMTYEIVRAAGGTVQLSTPEGGGASFEILLPWAEPAAPEALPPAEALEAGTGETILLADDQPLFRETACAILESLGYTVREASSGDEALRLFEADPDGVALALLDVTMPGLDGAQTARALRALREDLPVLFATGYDHQILDGLELPGPAPIVLEKPFDIAQLSKRLAQALKPR